MAETCISIRQTFHDDQDVTIGDIVELNHTYDYVHGIIKFIGEIPTLRHKIDAYFGNVYYGVELFSIEHGENNGCIHNIRYFDTKDNVKKGIFIRRNKIERIIHFNFDNPRVTINDVLFLTKYNCNGIVRYIGTPNIQFENGNNNNRNINNNDSIQYGIELKEEKGTNNGCINNRIYFSYCRNDYGVFLNRIDLQHLIHESKDSLLVHGYLKQIYISKDIITLIKAFYHIIKLKIVPNKYNTPNNKHMVNKKYNFMDISGNVIGPIIECGGIIDGMNEIYEKTVIKGYYGFEKAMLYNQITKNNKGKEEIIYRKSIYSHLTTSTYWTTYFPQTNLTTIEKRNPIEILSEIAEIYRLSVKELQKTFRDNCIQLYVF
eukprot:256280_1